MALSEEKIVFKISNSELGEIRSVSTLGSGAAMIVKTKAEKEIKKKIAGALIPGLNYITLASLAATVAMNFMNVNGVIVTVTLTPETVTKIQRGEKYTFEKYSISDLDIIGY